MVSPSWHELLRDERYPRASGYDPDWVMDQQMGPNALWLAEGAAERLDLRSGMRVLDLGSGRAMTSVFLAREFGVEVWAADLWTSASDNWSRVQAFDPDIAVHPVWAEAHALPFPHEFFDAVMAFDAYQYFGTDDLYLGYVSRFLRPGGQLGVVVVGFVQEPVVVPPPTLASHWSWDMCCWHSPAWWQTHWDKTGLLEDVAADLLPGGRELWLRWERAYAENSGESGSLELLAADVEENLGFVRIVGTLPATAA